MISRRTLLAAAMSLVLLVLVIWVADVGAIDLSALDPMLLVPAAAAYILVLVIRGAMFKLLSPAEVTVGLWTWIALAGRHQLIFVLSPSGAGDLAFPLLAGRMAGMQTAPAVGLIAGARLRDVCAVLCLGCAGLSGTGHLPLFTAFGALFFGAALYCSDITLKATGGLLRWLRKMPPASNDVVTGRAQRTPVAVLSLLLWLTASGGLAAGFAAAGFPLGLFEAWVMLAGLNLAGALALSIAGFGVAEAGAAGVLVFLGLPLQEAAAVAIVARPLLFLSNAVASGAIEAVSGLIKGNRPAD